MLLENSFWQDLVSLVIQLDIEWVGFLNKIVKSKGGQFILAALRKKL